MPGQGFRCCMVRGGGVGVVGLGLGLEARCCLVIGLGLGLGPVVLGLFRARVASVDGHPHRLQP